MKAVNVIKLINQKDFKKLISDGVIGECSIYGNNNDIGKHSSGFYDVKEYNKAKRECPEASDKYLKMVTAHVGVVITKNQKIYIEESYVK